jgi:hypothetical protein
MCPMCYISFENPDTLQEHFELTHADNDLNNKSVASSPSTQSIASASASVTSNSLENQYGSKLNDQKMTAEDTTSSEQLLNELNMWKEQLLLSEETRMNCRC